MFFCSKTKLTTNLVTIYGNHRGISSKNIAIQNASAQNTYSRPTKKIGVFINIAK